MKLILKRLNFEAAEKAMEAILNKDIEMPVSAVLATLDYAKITKSMILKDFIFLCLGCGGYDPRARVTVREMTRLLDIESRLPSIERFVGESIVAATEVEETEEERQEREGREKSEKRRRWLKIGAGVAIGGTLIGVTGGLAAPFVAAGAGMWSKRKGRKASACTLPVRIVLTVENEHYFTRIHCMPCLLPHRGCARNIRRCHPGLHCRDIRPGPRV